MSDRPETSEVQPNTWNAQLSSWYKSSGLTPTQIKDKTGIPKSSWSDYVSGKITDLGRVSPDRRKILLELTGLEVFRYHGPRIDMGAPKASPNGSSRDKTPGPSAYDAGRQKLETAVDEATSDLSGDERFRSGLLKAQRYTPKPEERAQAILELLDVLAEEVDYFRTAPDNEQAMLVEALQSGPESYTYASQMLEIMIRGDQTKSWMTFAQPPSKLRRLNRGRDK